MALNNWQKSFTALLNAYEQIQPGQTQVTLPPRKQPSFNLESSNSTTSSQTDHLPRTTTSNKRKNAFEDGFNSKSIKANNLNQFCTRFNGSIVLDASVKRPVAPIKRQPDSTINQVFSIFIDDYISRLSYFHGVSVEPVKQEWLTKKNELESNISMIVNGFPSDSYDDARLLAVNVNECAKWLCEGNYLELEKLVPSFKLNQTKIMDLTSFIQIIENVRETKFPILGNDLLKNCESVLKFLLQKQDIYGSCLQHGSLAWRVLGFPVDDVERELANFREQTTMLVLSTLTKSFKFTLEFSVAASSWEVFSTICMDSVQTTALTLQILGNIECQPKLLELASKIAKQYLQETDNILKMLINLKKFKYPDSRICSLYENVIQLFKFILSIPAMFDLNSNDGMEVDDPTYFHKLFHPAIELGLVLCEYCNDEKRPSLKKFKPMIMSLCKRYISHLSSLMQDVLDLDIIARIGQIS